MVFDYVIFHFEIKIAQSDLIKVNELYRVFQRNKTHFIINITLKLIKINGLSISENYKATSEIVNYTIK